MTIQNNTHTLDWRVQPPYLHPDYKSTVKRSPQKPLVPLKPLLIGDLAAAVAVMQHNPAQVVPSLTTGQCFSCPER